MCIYLTSTPSLTYTSQEHIIPAALGGIQKLPMNYVSDQFNNGISTLEQHFIRTGLVSIGREMVGPGKRGSLSESKATKSEIYVITDANGGENFSLGYTVNGKIKELPYLVYNLDSNAVLFSVTKGLNDIHVSLNTWKHTAAAGLKIRVIHDELIPIQRILIGIENGIEENFNCFIAKYPATSFKPTVEIMQEIIGKLNFSQANSSEVTYWPRGKQTKLFKENHLRIYGKIAMNFLALVKGDKFLLQDYFDPVRNWIVDGGVNDFAVIISEDRDGMKGLLTEDAHGVFITCINNEIFAHVRLFNAFPVAVRLSKGFNNIIASDGLICKWKRKKEMRLAEYVMVAAKGN